MDGVQKKQCCWRLCSGSLPLLLGLGLLSSGTCANPTLAFANETRTGDSIPREYFSSAYSHPAMGTLFRIVITGERGKSTAENLARIAQEAFDEIDRIENIISEWRPDSQTTYLNEHAGGKPVPVHNDLFRLLSVSKHFHEVSGGTFDVTVGPLVTLWQQCRKEQRIPTKDELSEVLGVVGSDKLILEDLDRKAGLAKVGMSITTGGIGKGFALDKAAEVLRFHGVTSAILDGGESSVVAIGTPPGELGWTVQVRHPYNKQGSIETVVLKDESYSASAGMGDSYVVDGKGYGHIFDPRTGMPPEGMVMVVAIAPTGAESEALTKMFYIQGREAAERYCQENPDVRAVLVPEPASGELEPVRINFGT
ncbi:MAG: hypothetical protein AMXMBFR84_25790 [Candidatus Hydrogenedentota bacterium]